MDTERLEALEKQIAQLIQVFIRLKDDNIRLRQRLTESQSALHEHQDHLEEWQSVQDELSYLRTVTETLQQERGLIRHKLEEMLAAIERLEGFPHVPGNI